jgi:hypothetical protein
MRWRAVLLALPVALLCSCSHPQSPPPPSSSGGGNFWPVYLQIIQGNGPPDTACHPKDLYELLMPCELR